MKSSMNAGSGYVSENSLAIEFEESRISSTFVFAPELAWRSCRSSGRAGDVMRNRARNVNATRWRSTKPLTPRDLRCRMALLS